MFERREFIIEGNGHKLDVCSSFSAGDCNARLSLIFDKRTFGYPNEEEEHLILFVLVMFFPINYTNL